MQDSNIVDTQPVRASRRSYTRKFKTDVVAQCERGDRSLAQVAMDNQINANLVRRWQKELNSEPGPTKLLPINVTQRIPASDPNGYIEHNIDTNTLKVVGAVDSQYVAQLIRQLR